MRGRVVPRDPREGGEQDKPDLILMPIGGHFVMDPQDAAYATREWLKPKFVIPMHYGTTPVLKGTPQEYIAALGQTDDESVRDQSGGSAGVLGPRRSAAGREARNASPDPTPASSSRSDRYWIGFRWSAVSFAFQFGGRFCTQPW